jgi:hypothetical protein
VQGVPPSSRARCRLYRKAPLFDRFVKFDVQVEIPNNRH